MNDKELADLIAKLSTPVNDFSRQVYGDQARIDQESRQRWLIQRDRFASLREQRDFESSFWPNILIFLQNEEKFLVSELHREEADTAQLQREVAELEARKQRLGGNSPFLSAGWPEKPFDPVPSILMGGLAGLTRK